MNIEDLARHRIASNSFGDFHHSARFRKVEGAGSKEKRS